MEGQDFKFALGTKVVHNPTGAKGTLTGRCQFNSGVNRVEVSGLDSTGRPFETWFYEADMSQQEAAPDSAPTRTC